MARKGRTRVIGIRVQGDSADAVLVGKFRRGEAEAVAERCAYENEDFVFCAVGENGDAWHWHGRSLAHPVPVSDGYRRTWYASDASMRIHAARLAGTVLLDRLSSIGDRTTGELPLKVVVHEPGKWAVHSSTQYATTPAALRALAHPHGMPRLAHACARSVPSVMKALTAWATRIADGTAEPWNTGSPDKILDQLNLLLPQRVPDQLIQGSEVRAAWVLPSGRDWYRRGADTLSYQLLTLSESGDLCLRTVLDTHDYSVLPTAARCPKGDALYDRSSADRLGEWVRGKDADCFSLYGLWIDERVPERATDLLTAAVSEAIAGIAKQVYALLEIDLRDTFAGCDDYNLLHAAGDSEKASARRQASSAIWGGLSILLSQNKAGKALLATVDARFKLQRAAAKALKVKPWVIRRLTASDHAVLDRLEKYVGFADLPRVLQWLGPQVRIRSHFDATKVGELLEFTTQNRYGDEAVLQGSPLAILEFRVAMVGRTIVQFGWEGALEIVRSAALSGTSRVEVLDYLRFACSCFDVMLDERLANGYSVDSADTRVMKAMLIAFSSATLADLVRWSGRYHDLVATIPIPDGDESTRRRSFPPVPEVLPDTALPIEGWMARQLRDQDALNSEGREMRHCVADYGSRVATRATAIFSLIGPEDRVTVEVVQSAHAGWRMVQARRAGNKVVLPGTPAHVALDAFLSVLDSCAIKDKTPKSWRSTARDPREYRHSGYSFAHRLVEAFGLQGWTRLRGALPGSAHGRVETKLWESYVAANPTIPTRMEDHSKMLKELYGRMA